MPDSLRDRIAAVIEQNLAAQLPSDLPDRYYEWIGYDTLADAVIAELGLHMQYENGRVMYNEKPAACKPNGLWQQRIVSPHEPYTGD